MSRKFESADPLRRGPRRPNALALRAAAQRAAQARITGDSAPLNPPKHQPGNGAAAAGAAAQPMQEFALKMCTEDDLESARYHLLKFHSQVPVDPGHDFVPPIRMQRKDPKQLQVVAGDEMDVDPETGESNGGAGPNGGGVGGVAAVAGDGTEPSEERRFQRKRKTHQVYGGEKNEAARKLRYEEHYPWIMEDFDSKNTWISSYEAAQSNNYAILTYDPASNGFKVVPIEKVYKMTAAARHATLSLEDAEKRMESKHTMRDRWMMSHLQPRGAGELPSADQAHAARLRTVVGSEERKHKYTLDEAMDFDDQELFDDDEGAPILDGPEEDLKEAEDRIKQEQLKANELMGGDEDVDELFEEDETKEGRQGRKVRRALRSLEKNQYYDTDDENNPYASSDSDDSDEIEQAMVKKEVDDQAQAAQVAAEATASMLASQFRRRTINRDSLPRGTVVLQLPPQILARFPRGEWNPGARRATSEEQPEDSTLLTRNDVRKHIKSGETDLKQLLVALKPKLAENPGNRALLKQYIKEVARHRDGKLILRN